MSSSARMYVCDLHDCPSYGRLLILPNEPRPRCDDCWMPLYELPSTAYVGVEDVICTKISEMTGAYKTHIRAKMGRTGRTHKAKQDKIKCESLQKVCLAYGLDPNDIVQYDPAMQLSGGNPSGV